MEFSSSLAMPRYQFRRPTPIKVLTTLEKRQEAGLGAVGPGSEGEVPESPDSPKSSPSTPGVLSPGDSSDSENDEPPSPKESSTSITSSQISSTFVTSSNVTTLSSSSRPTFNTFSQQPTTPTQTSLSTKVSRSSSAFAQMPTSRGIGAVAPPQVTTTSTTMVISRSSSIASPTSSSSTIQVFSSKTARTSQPIASTMSMLPPPAGFTGSPLGENDAPRRTRPEPTLMSKGAEAAAITLSIIGAIALALGILFYCKRRRRRRNAELEAELEHDAANYAALRAPEKAHNSAIAPSATTGPHMTQTSDRSNTLFGSGSYARPETVSTTRDQSRIPMAQPTPNPFADPPLNKAYDVLAGRPRSTTLTDRGSWIKNPFKDPESERFDPFGELQAKARRERKKQVELARREAELERQFEEKAKMGLVPPEGAKNRKGSGVTLGGLGVLDRGGSGEL